MQTGMEGRLLPKAFLAVFVLSVSERKYGPDLAVGREISNPTTIYIYTS
jgi:hypothetical protein